MRGTGACDSGDEKGIRELGVEETILVQRGTERLNLRGEGKKNLIFQRVLYWKLVQIRGWVGKTTISSLEFKKFVKGRWAKLSFVVSKLKNGWEG